MSWSKGMPWKVLSLAALAGASVVWIADAANRMHPATPVGWLFPLCPPSVMYMGAEALVGRQLFKLELFISLANAFLYTIVAAAIVGAYSLVRRSPPK